MNESDSCSQCGCAVPPDAPGGLCPTCLWQLCELADTSDVGDETLATSTAASSLHSTDKASGTAALDSRPQSGKELAKGPVLRRLGNYELIEELGRGGMGIVYKAVQRRADRIVAVKLIRGGAASEREHRERFESEIQALARLRHPNIVPVFEVGDEEGCPFFSMEYMPGGSLSEKAKQGPLPPVEAAHIVEQLCAAVEAAHHVGVLHRDIKPGNVLLDEAGTPKLTDFGLAKRLDSEASLTNTGSILGTPSYMPPEQARGERELSPAADVYSLGATLYALLTSRPPFAGQSFHDTLQRVVRDDPPSPRSHRPDLSRDLEAVCLKCLEKDPTRRYPTAQALAEDLSRWQRGESTVARPQTLAQRAWRQVRRRWRVAVLAAAVLTITIAAIVANRWRDPRLAIDSALRRGEKVTLIPATGPPVWHRWAAGTGSISDTGSQAIYQFFSPGPAYLELVPRLPVSRYRISAEFRHDQSTNPNSFGGIYFGFATSPPQAAGSVSRAISAMYRDDLINHRPGYTKGDPLEVQDCQILSSPERPFRVGATPLANSWIQESKAGWRPWRRVVAEVNDDGIRVWFYRDISAAPVAVAPAPVPYSTLEQVDRQNAGWLAENAPELSAVPLAFDRAGGCGICVRNARVFFRNVTIEPLPKPKE